MALRLRAIGARAAQLGEAASKVFGVHGGSVGRADDNEWILPDPERYVSGHHARIDYRDGGYWLTDTSSNGTFVNDAETPISEQGPCALKDGDRVRIGEYDVLISIEPGNDFPLDKSAIVAYDGKALRSRAAPPTKTLARNSTSAPCSAMRPRTTSRAAWLAKAAAPARSCQTTPTAWQ